MLVMVSSTPCSVAVVVVMVSSTPCGVAVVVVTLSSTPSWCGCGGGNGFIHPLVVWLWWW